MEEFSTLTEDILNNDNFKKMKYIEHHGSTRYDHLMKVSYSSYKIAKLLHFRYKEVARAALLHDFFYSDELRTQKEKFISTFTHPKLALENSMDNFELNDIEKNIIKSHMFPIAFYLPKYKESILVSIVDKCVASLEFAHKFKIKFRYAFNVISLLVIGIIK